MIFRYVPQQLKDAADSGKLIVFIGAGVSRTMGWNSWWGYAKAKLDYIYQNNFITKEEYSIINIDNISPRQILSICDVILKEHNHPIKDEKQFLLTGAEKYNKIYENIYSLNAIYITTNYDHYLDRLTDNSKVFYNDSDFLVSKLLVPGNVLHIHGGMKSNQSPVITLWDYLARYAHNTNLSNLLKTVFKNYYVLFVGYGLAEYEILEYIISVAERGSKAELRHFLLYPLTDEEKTAEQLYEKYYYKLGVQLLSYEVGPKDKGNYDILDDITAQLVDEIKAHSPYVLDKLKFLDGVEL